MGIGDDTADIQPLFRPIGHCRNGRKIKIYPLHRIMLSRPLPHQPHVAYQTGVHRLANHPNGHAELAGHGHRPTARSLLAGTVADFVEEQAIAQAIGLAQNSGRNLEQIAGQFPFVPIGKQIGNGGWLKMEGVAQVMVHLGD